MQGIDAVELTFNPSSLVLLNVILGLIMFGIALDLRVADFRRILEQPRGVLTAVVGQLVLLPAMTFLIILWLQPHPSVALGMLLVSTCPGGNVSNFLTHLGRGSASLSITTTAFSTALCVVATPFNLHFWASRYGPTNALLETVNLDPVNMFVTIFTILGIPLVLGMSLNARRADWAERLRKPMKVISMLFLAGFIGVALINNWGPFLDHIGAIFGLVFLHNASAFTLGSVLGASVRLERPERRAVTMEMGIQNSGLALVLIFTFFEGLGGMAIIAAWWGVWHILAGGTLVALWRRI